MIYGAWIGRFWLDTSHVVDHVPPALAGKLAGEIRHATEHWGNNLKRVWLKKRAHRMLILKVKNGYEYP